MGYYSDVALVLSPSAAKKFKELVEARFIDKQKYYEDLLSEVLFVFEHKIAETGDNLFLWKEIKWYKSWPEVEFVMNFINHLNNADYRYIESGEGWYDLVVRGGYLENAFNLGFSKEITYVPH